MQIAAKYHLTGTVKNLGNGDVESYMQGPKSAVIMTVNELKTVSPWIRIDDYFMKEVDLVEDEKGFNVVY